MTDSVKAIQRKIKKMRSGRVALDFGEKGSDDVFWALEVRLG